VADEVTGPEAAVPASCVAWAVAERALAGETENGDRAVHVGLDDGALVAVVDGLGHGPEAALAAARAVAVVEGHAGMRVDAVDVDAIVAAAHATLARTRGVAMTIATIGCGGELRWVGVGNVEAHVLRADGPRAQRVASAVLYGGVVGYRLPRLRVSTARLDPGDLVVMATDGIAVDFTDQVVPGDAPARLVERVLERSARANDDALVAAARYLGRAP
jgi:hypothetical protein